MTKGDVAIGQASEADLDGILDLQAANQPERGGALSASLPRSRIAARVVRVLFTDDGDSGLRTRPFWSRSGRPLAIAARLRSYSRTFAWR